MTKALTTDPKSTDELSLILAAQKGEAKAFEELVGRYTGMVYALAFARTQDRDTAEDLVQEVFLRAYTGLPRLTEPRYFATWLSRIARNLAADWHRRGQRRSKAIALLPFEDLPEMSDPRSDSIHDTIELQQQGLALNRAMARLTADQREILLLHYAEEWSLTDISQKLNIHRTTVGRHLEQALDCLRADIAPLVQESCRTHRARRKLSTKTAAAVAAFAVMPGVTRAYVISQIASGTAASGAATATATSGIVQITNAAAAAGGTLILKKTVIAGAVVVAGLLGAGYYAKDELGYFIPLFSVGPGRNIADTLPPAAPAGEVIIKPAAGRRMSGSWGRGTWRSSATNLQNAIANSYEGYNSPQIIFDGVDPQGQPMDISITAPAGKPEQLKEIAKREIPKAYKVTVTQEQREMDVLVLKAPAGDKQLKPGTGNGYATGSNKSITVTGTNIEGVAANLAGNAGIPVIDETGLKGKYDVTLEANLKDKSSLIRAVREQLGLELIPQRRTMPVLVVRKAS